MLEWGLSRLHYHGLDLAARREQGMQCVFVCFCSFLSQCELVALPCGLHSALFSIHSTAVVTGEWARAWWEEAEGGTGEEMHPPPRSPRPRTHQPTPLINYCLALFISLIYFPHWLKSSSPSVPCFMFWFFSLTGVLFTYLSIFMFAAPCRLRHMAADQIMSNILPLQVFFFFFFIFFFFFFLQFAAIRM